MIVFNLSKFMELQKGMTEEKMARVLGITRYQLRKIKLEQSSAGEKTIKNFLTVFPGVKFEEAFVFKDDSHRKIIRKPEKIKIKNKE